MPELKILTSHPVQYHVPFFRSLIAEGVEITVGYYHQGTAGRVGYDDGFGKDIAWDIDLLSGYPHRIFVAGSANYRWLEQIKVAPQLISWALKDRETPFLLMGWFAELTWLIWLLRIFRQAPIFVMSETTPASFAATPKLAWRVTLLRWLLQHSTANLYIGERNRAFLREMGVTEERLFHVPYSIDNTRFSAEARRLLAGRRNLCQQNGLNPELPTFLFSGKLIHKKRPLELLEAYRSAGLTDLAQLLYVGEGELRPELEQRIRELELKHVHLLGFLNQTQMPLAYVLGEVLCLISDPTETWGLVVNEALACGRPVIVSNTVGCSPELVDSENGWVTPLDDHSELVKTLIFVYKQRTNWKRMGTVGRKKVAKNNFTSMAQGIRFALRFLQETSTEKAELD